MLKELIKAIYEIAKAIKGDDGNNGGGANTNDNGLYGADGILVQDDVYGSFVYLSQKELFDDFKINYQQYFNDGNGRYITFLYTKNNIDKLLKPTTGIIGKISEDPIEKFEVAFLDEESLESYEFVSVQGFLNESDVQKIVEKLGNNVYLLTVNLPPWTPPEPGH